MLKGSWFPIRLRNGFVTFSRGIHMTIKLGINGFGRIGRLALRAALNCLLYTSDAADE